MHLTTKRFWACYDNLPHRIQRLARKNFELLKVNPQHLSLHFKKVGKFWSERIGRYHRSLAIKDKQDFIWVWIVTHKEHDEMVK